MDKLDKVKLLFEDLADELGPSRSRMQKYRNWVKSANIAREKSLSDAASNHARAYPILYLSKFTSACIRR